MTTDRRNFLQYVSSATAVLLFYPQAAAAQAPVLLTRDGAEYASPPFSAKNDTWGRAGLINGVHYTNTIEITPETFPAGTKMQWSWPAGGSVRSYNAVIYRPQRTPSAPAIRLDHIDTAIIAFDVTIDAADDSYYALSEGFIYESADLAWPPVAEVGVFYHPMPRFTPTTQDTVTIGNHTGTIVVEWTSDRDKWPFIKINLPQKIDAMEIDLVALFGQLKAIGLVTGREYFSSWKTGVEVLGGAGSMVINDKSVRFSASVKLSLSGTPVRTAFEDSPYDGFRVEAQDGAPPYAYSLLGNWPDGIGIDPATGIVSGAASDLGTYRELSVEVVDRFGVRARLPQFTLVVTHNERPVMVPDAHNHVTEPVEDFSLENLAVAGGAVAHDGALNAYRFTEEGGEAQHKLVVNGKRMSGLEAVRRMRAQAVIKGLGRNARFQLASADYKKQVLVSIGLGPGEEIHRYAVGGWQLEEVHISPAGGGYFLVAIDFIKDQDDAVRWLINVLDGRSDTYLAQEGFGMVAHHFYLTSLGRD